MLLQSSFLPELDQEIIKDAIIVGWAINDKHGYSLSEGNGVYNDSVLFFFKDPGLGLWYGYAYMIPFSRLGLIFKHFAGVIYPQEVRQHLQGIMHKIEPGGLVLDLGAGTGILSELARKTRSDLHYFALDPALDMLKYAPQYIGKAAGVAEALPLKDYTFSAVLIGDAIHHLHDPQKAIMEVRRVLKQKGIFFIFDIDPGTFMGHAICTMEKLLREPARFYSPEGLGDLLAENGFSVRANRNDWRYTITAELTG